MAIMIANNIYSSIQVNILYWLLTIAIMVSLEAQFQMGICWSHKACCYLVMKLTVIEPEGRTAGEFGFLGKLDIYCSL